MEQARILARILLEVGEPTPERLTSSAAGGDTSRLRGLPAIGRGVSGAVPGSDPLKALLAKEKRSGRGRP